MTDIKREISKVRAALVLDYPFFGALTLHGEIVPDKGIKGIPHIDGQKLRINPERFMEFGAAERKGETAAAFLACGLGHPYRRGARDKGTWSQASAIKTGMLVRSTGMHLPEDWPMPQPGMTDDDTVEALYSKIQQGPEGDDNGPEGDDGEGEGEGKGKGEPKPGDGDSDGDGDGDGEGDGDGAGGGYDIDDPTKEDGSSMEKTDKRQQEQEWEIRTIQAARAAKAMGSAPGFIEGLLDDILNPEIPWQQVLREYVELAAKNDYCWAKPNRRYSSGDFIMPNIDGENLGRILVLHDTSGSVSDVELAKFYGELSGILGEFPGVEVLFIQVDTQVSDVKTVTTDDLPLQPTVKGRGGTDFKPGFEYCIENNEDDFVCAIYFTDGECNSYPEEPDFPVLWVFTQKPGEGGSWCSEPPFGRLTVLNNDL